MEDLLLSGGNTPFEQAATRRLNSSKRVATMVATTELIKLIKECDQMIHCYREAMATYNDDPTPKNRLRLEEDLALATQALKDKRSAEAALDQLMAAAEELGFSE